MNPRRENLEDLRRVLNSAVKKSRRSNIIFGLFKLFINSTCSMLPLPLTSQLDKPNFSPDLALSIFTQRKLSRFQYEVIETKMVDHKISPSYKNLRSKERMLAPSDVNVTEVPLQSLIDHIVKIILKTK